MSSKQPITASGAPRPTAGAPYTQAIAFGDLVFVSGQLPLDPATGEPVAGGIAEQTARVMENIGAILDEAGSGLDRLLKTTVYLTDRDDWPAMNEVYARYVGELPPARAAVEVGRLAFDARVEIDAVASRAAT